MPLDFDCTDRTYVKGSASSSDTLACEVTPIDDHDAIGAPVSTTSTSPTLTLDKTSLTFGAVTPGRWGDSRASPGRKLVRSTQSGAGSVTWTAVPDQPWLRVSPASGVGSADLGVDVFATGGLPVGSAVAGTITFLVTGANAPGPITVTLNLIPNGLSARPFGVVDTPVQNSTGVTGAVPFTGWALDDVGVTQVLVCRAAVGGRSGVPQSDLRRRAADLRGDGGVRRRGAAGCSGRTTRRIRPTPGRAGASWS